MGKSVHFLPRRTKRSGETIFFVILGTLLGYLTRRFSWSLIEVCGTRVYLRAAVWSIGFLATRTHERFGLLVDGFDRRFTVSSFFRILGSPRYLLGSPRKSASPTKLKTIFGNIFISKPLISLSWCFKNTR